MTNVTAIIPGSSVAKPVSAQRDPLDAFRGSIATAGLSPPEEIQADGHIHRFSTNGKSGDNSGWYVLFLDGVPAGSFGDWRTCFQSTWSAKGSDVMTPPERRVMRERMRVAQVQRDAERSRTQRGAAVEAQQRWKVAVPAKTHPYLTAKRIQPHGSRIEGDKLLIALHDAAGAVCSLQTIAPDGSKRFLPDGAVRGLHFMIGRASGSIVICEGFATGASIHEATGHAVAVAFNCGNLESVARAIRSKFPCLTLIIAADDDWQTPGNPGRTRAKAAALAVGGDVVLPFFPAQRPEKATDFNDLHQLCGLDAVRQCLAESGVLA